MYRIISVVSYLVRQFIFPNPFDNMFKSGIAELVNYGFGGILITLSYLLTGTWYNGGTSFIGSLGFFINYALLTGIILLITHFFTKIVVVITIFMIVYIILCIFEGLLLNR